VRILVVQTAFLGDVVLTTPLLRELRRAQPAAELTVVATRTGRDALAGSGLADRVLSLDKRRTPAGFVSEARLLLRLAAGGFDVAVAPHRSLRTGLMLRVSGAALRAGFAGAPGAWAYTRRVPWLAHEHAVRRYLELARVLGGDPDAADPTPALGLEPQAVASVGRMLNAAGIGPGKPYLAVAPGARWRTKRWTPSGFTRVVDEAQRLGLAPVLVGSREDLELCRAIAAACRVPPAITAGGTSVAELIALIAGARALVANDSGPAHVASAVGTPVVTIFGPTSPVDGRAPWGDRNRVVGHPDLDCRPCSLHGPRRCPRGHFRCMRDLAPDPVVAALHDVLRVPGGRAAAG